MAGPSTPDTLGGDLQDWQFYFNGLKLGPGTHYYVNEVSGLGDVAMRVEEADRTEADGGFVFARYVGVRTVQISGVIIAADASTRLSDVGRLSAAFAPQAEDLPLIFRLGGDAIRRVYGKPTKRSAPTHGVMVRSGVVQWAVEVVCQNPLIYGNGVFGGDGTGGTTGGAGGTGNGVYTYGGMHF